MTLGCCKASGQSREHRENKREWEEVKSVYKYEVTQLVGKQIVQLKTVMKAGNCYTFFRPPAM